MEDTFTMKERPHRIKAKIKFEKKAESKDEMAKIVAGCLGKTVKKLMYSQMIESKLVAGKKGAQAAVSTSYGYASLRLAMKNLTKTNLTKREQTFLLRLVSSTLPTMEMVQAGRPANIYSPRCSDQSLLCCSCGALPCEAALALVK